jgi:hypothetical protein
MSNILSAQNQVKLKEQIIEMEKELETLRARAGQDIDRYVLIIIGDGSKIREYSFHLCERPRFESCTMISAACGKSTFSLILPKRTVSNTY